MITVQIYYLAKQYLGLTRVVLHHDGHNGRTTGGGEWVNQLNSFPAKNLGTSSNIKLRKHNHGTIISIHQLNLSEERVRNRNVN